MAIIAGMLNGTNQNKDADFQAMPSFLLSAGVRKNFSTELLVETNLVKAGQAFVKVKRESVSPNEEFIIPITLTADTVIATSGTGYVCLTVNSAKVNDGGSNAVDGTGIAQIEVLGTLPTKNFLLLATLASGVITDSRVFAKLSQEVLDFLGKGDVELGNVPNYAMASQEEAEAGTAEDKFMSPFLVKRAILINSDSGLSAVAGEDIPENSAVAISTDGKAYVCQPDVPEKSKVKGYTIDGAGKDANCAILDKGEFPTTGLSAGEAYYETKTNFGIGPYMGGGNSQNLTTYATLYQTFKARKSSQIKSIRLRLSKYNNPTDGVFVKIFNEAGGVLLATSSTVLASEFGNSFEIKEFFFDGFTQTKGTMYRFQLFRTGAGSDTNYYSWRYSSSSVYADGVSSIGSSYEWDFEIISFENSIKKYDVNYSKMKIEQLTHNAQIEVGASTSYREQTWIPTDDAKVKSISFLATSSYQWDNIYVDIYRSGSLVASSAKVSVATYPIVQQEFVATFATPVHVYAGETGLAFRVRSSSLNGTYFPYLRYQDSGNPYPDGGFTGYATADLWFKIEAQLDVFPEYGGKVFRAKSSTEAMIELEDDGSFLGSFSFGGATSTTAAISAGLVPKGTKKIIAVIYGTYSTGSPQVECTLIRGVKVSATIREVEANGSMGLLLGLIEWNTAIDELKLTTGLTTAGVQCYCFSSF